MNYTRKEMDYQQLLDASQVPQPGDLFSNELEGRIINNPQRDLCTIEAKTSQIQAIAERYPDGTRVTITITPKP